MKIFLTIVLAGLLIPALAQNTDHLVDSGLAGTVAAKIITQVSGAKDDFRSLSPFISSTSPKGDQPAYYVVGFANRPGYELVSGTRLVTPVIGFSTTDRFDTVDMPPAMKAFLRNWEHSIKRAIEEAERKGAAPAGQSLQKWDYMENILLENTEAGNAARSEWDSIPPLMVTKWGQRYPYNAKCPMYPGMGYALAGCGPIAMAQVMRYHEYPDSYDWSQMGVSHHEYNEELAYLISDCGEAAGTTYLPIASATRPYDIDDAFQSAFGFPSARYDDIPNAGKKGGYEYIIKTSIENGFPVIIDGYEEWNIFDWHLFVMDGYHGLSNGWMGWFHINWGWSGKDNGFFQLEDCNPPGDPGPYNYNQGIVWRMIPPHKVTLVSPVSGSTLDSKTPVPIAWQSEGRAADMQNAMIVIYQENTANTVTGHNELNFDTIYTTNQPGQNTYIHQFDSPNVSLADSGFASVQIILYGTYGDNAKYRFFSDKNPFFVRHGEFMEFTSPVSGTNWQANMPHTVSWNYNENTSPTFSVKYKKVSGPSTALASGEVILNSTQNSVDWLIPANLEGTYKLEGYKWGDPQIRCYSDHFTIGPKPTMDVTLPHSNQQFHPGNTLSIRWTSNASENFRIILQRWDDWDPGDTLVLAGSTPNDGEFDWQIPDNMEPGVLYSIVVKGTINPQIVDGVFYFEIRKRVSVNAPVQNAEWEKGKPYYVEWTDNFSDKVAIRLYRGTAFHSSVSDSTESDGLHAFTVPDTITAGSNYRIRVHMITDTTVADYSDFFFIIPKRYITVTDPAPNATWQAGQSYNINWSTNVPSGIKIELVDYTQNPRQITLIDNGTYPPYSWTIPSGISIHNQYKIRLTSVQYPDVSTLSDFFSIVAPPEIEVTTPTAVTTWPTATTQTITWTDNLSGNVNIYLYRRNVTPGFIATLASGIPSTGSFTWFIPQTYTPSNDYYLIVRSADYPTIQDASDDFTISQGDYILVTTPSLGAQWEAGSKKNIYWDDNIPENVTIILQKYGMGISDTITHSTYSDGSYSWIVPTNTVPGTNYNIKINSVSNPGIFDISDPFEIYNTSGSFISVTSPTEDSVWKMGTQHTITWDDNISGAVKVHLYKGGVQAVILSAFNLNSSLTFTVPTSLTPGTDYQAKVTSAADPSLFDFSPDFEITPADFINYTGPGAFRMNDTVSISWNDNITEHVKIELYHSDTLYSVITPSTESDGEYTWGVPSGFPVQQWYKIKISRDGSPALSDMSGSVPIYFPYYAELTSPSAGEVWLADSAYAIQWDDNLINNEHYNIDLFKGGDSIARIRNYEVSQYYMWSLKNYWVPLANGDDYSIRVSCIEKPDIIDFSETFSILHCDSVVFSIGPDTTLLLNGEIDLMASDGFESYLWSPYQAMGRIQHLSGGTFNGPGTESIRCTAVYAGGCIKKDTLILTLDYPPCVVDASFSMGSYRGEEMCNRYCFWVPFDNNARHHYKWDLGDGTIVETTDFYIEHDYAGAGIYEVTCIDYDPEYPQVCSDTVTNSVVIHPAPLMDFIFTSVNDTGRIVPDITGSSTYKTKWWVNNVPTQNILPDSLAGDTMMVTFPVNGTYDICMGVWDANNPSCIFIHCDEVTVTTIPPCFTTTCSFAKKPNLGYGTGVRNQFYFQGSVNERLSCYTVTWDLGDGTPVFSDTLEFLHTYAPGTYIASMTVTDCGACSYTYTDTITAYGYLEPGLSDTLQGCDTVVLTPTPGLAGYIWPDSSTNEQFPVTVAGNYWVTVLDGNGYYHRDTSMVLVAPFHNVTLSGIPVLCSDGEPYILSEGSPSGGVYSGSHISGGTFDIQAAGAGFYQVKYYFQDNYGCSDTASGVLEVEPVSQGVLVQQNYTYTNTGYYTGDTILTGYQVTDTIPPGPLVIQNGANVTFKAQSAIRLLPGTTIESGSSFHAVIGPLACIKEPTIPSAPDIALLPAEEQKGDIILGPNPAHDKTILFHTQGVFDGYRMVVYSGQGYLLIPETLLYGNQFVLDVSSYRPGIYFIRIWKNGNSQTLKLIRE